MALKRSFGVVPLNGGGGSGPENEILIRKMRMFGFLVFGGFLSVGLIRLGDRWKDLLVVYYTEIAIMAVFIFVTNQLYLSGFPLPLMPLLFPLQRETQLR